MLKYNLNKIGDFGHPKIRLGCPETLVETMGGGMKTDRCKSKFTSSEKHTFPLWVK